VCQLDGAQRVIEMPRQRSRRALHANTETRLAHMTRRFPRKFIGA